MKYYFPEHGEKAEDAQEFKSDGRSWGLHWVAEYIMKCEYDRWGWEAQWPQTVTIIDDLGEEHTFEVDREMRTVFRASFKRGK